MSMADDSHSGSYRSHDPHLPAGDPATRRDPAKASDPLAELARLIGQSDPFAELGRNSQRQPQSGNYPHDPSPVQGGYVTADDWAFLQARAQRGADYSQPAGRDPYVPSEPPVPAAAYEPRPEVGRAHNPYDEPAVDPRYQAQHGARQHADERIGNDHPHGGHDIGDYENDVPLEPHEDAMYDDAPRRRRHGGLATALALIGCAMLGTAGAYGYRSYYSHPTPSQPPRVITADSSTPTKIVPIAAGKLAIQQDQSGAIGARRQGASRLQAGGADRREGAGNPGSAAGGASGAGRTSRSGADAAAGRSCPVSTGRTRRKRLDRTQEGQDCGYPSRWSRRERPPGWRPAGAVDLHHPVDHAAGAQSCSARTQRQQPDLA